MTNQEVFGYKPFDICEGHFHLSFPYTVDESVKMYKNIFNYFGYERGSLMCYLHDVQENFYADNAKALYIKDVFNKAEPGKKLYACASLCHYFDERDTADGYLEQGKLMYLLGFDGFKMLEGKPGLRKKLGRRLDDAILDKFYAYAEEMHMPITMHVADPPSFWDRSKVSEYALKKGWFCDETFPTLAQFREETESVLAKFPKLSVTLAHFYFISQDLDYTVNLMEKYPNVRLDLTPGGEMFANFTKRIDDWRKFFVKYADRIDYGTDTYNMLLSDNLEDYGKHYIQHRINLVRRTLEYSEPFEDSSYGTIIPLNLDDVTLSKIYRENFITKYGEVRDVCDASASEYAGDLLMKYQSGALSSGNAEQDAMDIANLKTVYSYFNGSDPVSN